MSCEWQDRRQRPRMPKANSFFKIFGNYKTLALRWAERVFSPSGARAQRGRWSEEIKKPRGRGLGQRNINGWRVLIELLFLKLLFSFLGFIATFFQNPCCAARGHALAIWHRCAAPRSTALAALGLRSAAKCAPRRATTFIDNYKFKYNWTYYETTISKERLF